MLPWLSNDGGSHRPPPELTAGFPHRSCTSSHDHSGAPVAALSAQSADLAPPRYWPLFGLTGTVDTYTVPSW